MKILRSLSLALVLLNSNLNFCIENKPLFDYVKLGQSLKKVNNYSTILTPILTFGVASGLNYAEFQKIKNYSDMPEELINWCKSVFSKYNIIVPNDLKYKIKIVAQNEALNLWAAHLNNHIIIDNYLVEPILKALQNPELQSSKEELYINEFFLLHEFCHIKSKDVVKRIFLPTLSMAALGKIVHHFVNPELSKPTPTFKPFLKSLSIFAFANFIKNKIIEFASMSLMRSQETHADQFAISKITDINQLNSLISIWQKQHVFLLSVVERPEIIIQTNFNFIIKNNFLYSYNIALSIYKLSRSQDSFKTWLEKNPYFLRSIHASYDPSHPFSFDRIKLIENRIKELNNNK